MWLKSGGVLSPQNGGIAARKPDSYCDRSMLIYVSAQCPESVSEGNVYGTSGDTLGEEPVTVLGSSSAYPRKDLL
ncbi:hypothetical protein BJ997_003574 [Cryobacterium roopkundense]|uniref:Uncharacterized protein n=1 Tax=Cryobacterium roopkundense TaxID=1001240 RepID=A0A7W9E5C1_9MICO|nr:hypothetical protein [Cryobacterium roopkundense]